jgi:hypothetical protein
MAQTNYENVLYLTPPLSTTSLAVEIATPSGAGLSGLRWYHNDGQVAFPRLILLEGEPGAGPNLDDAALILLDLTGESLSWGEVDFEGPVTSSTGTAYAVFYYPEGLEATGLGEGSGPGIGIRQAEGTAPFYLTGDGQSWVQFDQDYEIGIEPIYSQGKRAARVLSEIKAEILAQQPETPERYSTELLAPRPNPFNPRVELGFTLGKPGLVELVVYDVRGRLVTTLLRESKSTGAHSVVWMGTDGRGRSVASGVYIARMEANGQVQQRRLALIR